MAKTLRVYARGTALEPNLEALDAGARRFIARDPQVRDDAIAWVPRTEPTTIPARAEYVAAVRAGSLWPADQESADTCGVAFDPTFGGTVVPAQE